MPIISRSDLTATKAVAGLAAAAWMAVPVWLTGLWVTGGPLPWTSTTVSDGPSYGTQAHYAGTLEWSIAGASPAQWVAVILTASLAAVAVALGASAIWRMVTLIQNTRAFTDEFVAALRWLAGAVGGYWLVGFMAPPVLTMTVMSPIWDSRQALWIVSPSDAVGPTVCILLILLAQLWSDAVAAAKDTEGLV